MLKSSNSNKDIRNSLVSSNTSNNDKKEKLIEAFDINLSKIILYFSILIQYYNQTIS